MLIINYTDPGIPQGERMVLLRNNKTNMVFGVKIPKDHRLIGSLKDEDTNEGRLSRAVKDKFLHIQLF